MYPSPDLCRQPFFRIKEDPSTSNNWMCLSLVPGTSVLDYYPPLPYTVLWHTWTHCQPSCSPHPWTTLLHCLNWDYPSQLIPLHPKVIHWSNLLLPGSGFCRTNDSPLSSPKYLQQNVTVAWATAHLVSHLWLTNTQMMNQAPTKVRLLACSEGYSMQG